MKGKKGGRKIKKIRRLMCGLAGFINPNREVLGIDEGVADQRVFVSAAELFAGG